MDWAWLAGRGPSPDDCGAVRVFSRWAGAKVMPPAALPSVGQPAGTDPTRRTFGCRQQRESDLERIRILNETLWAEVPKDVIAEAERAAKASPVWIARQGNGHIVAMDGPGDPDVATGDVMFIAEVAPDQA